MKFMIIKKGNRGLSLHSINDRELPMVYRNIMGQNPHAGRVGPLHRPKTWKTRAGAERFLAKINWFNAEVVEVSK